MEREQHGQENAPGVTGGQGHGAAGGQPDPVAMLERANAVALGVIEGVGPAALGAQSPCPEWTVRDVVNHLVQGQEWSVANLAGDGSPQPRPQGDLLGEHPARAFADGAAAEGAAFRAPEIRAKMLQLPFGTMPAAAFAGAKTIEVLVHTWDIARGSGQPTADLDPQLYESTLAAAKRMMTFDRAGSPFGAEQPIAADAPAADRLAAFLGRRV